MRLFGRSIEAVRIGSVQGPVNAQCDCLGPSSLRGSAQQGRRARASTPTYGMASFWPQCLMGWCPSAPTKACGAATMCEWKTGGFK